MMTGHPGMFAGGDMVPSERTVTIAVGHGKRAARHIDAWLRETRLRGAAAKHRWSASPCCILPVYSDADPTPQRDVWRPRAASAASTKSWPGSTRSRALDEAQRCLSCGNCFECDNCFAACPETAIIKLGPTHGYRVDLDLCTGCAVCFEQCPCHAMEMVPEPAGSHGMPRQ